MLRSICILYRERNGFVVWYKRLEKQRFKLPRQCESGYELRDGRDLNFLLDGLDIWRNKPHEILYVDSVSQRFFGIIRVMTTRLLPPSFDDIHSLNALLLEKD
ncbi:MAG: hypothetical protein ACI9BO_002415 [Zhongshania sp.]|jgi:hypothetical protein